MTAGQTRRPEGWRELSPSGSLLKDTGAQTKRGDLHRTPDQPPCGREKEKQRALAFSGFQGASVNKL